jgi:uncharacterized protein (DUF305 family)
MRHSHYIRLLIMAALSFVSMYVLMYVMIDRFGNVFNNLNQFYTAGLMTAPMVVIELLLMKGMYEDARRNSAIVASNVLALVAFFLLNRQQVAITDQQFLRSVIPHHPSAILMCQQAPISDPKIKEL